MHLVNNEWFMPQKRMLHVTLLSQQIIAMDRVCAGVPSQRSPPNVVDAVEEMWCSVSKLWSVSVCRAHSLFAAVRVFWFVHCKTSQHTATHCNTLQHTSTQSLFAAVRVFSETQSGFWIYRKKEWMSVGNSVAIFKMGYARHCNTHLHVAVTATLGLCKTLQHTPACCSGEYRHIQSTPTRTPSTWALQTERVLRYRTHRMTVETGLCKKKESSDFGHTEMIAGIFCGWLLSSPT